MKRRDFIKFAGAVPFAMSQLKFIGRSDPLYKTQTARNTLNPKSSTYLLSDLNIGDHFIIGARPGMGKTALAFNILLDLALDQKSGCAIFSLEISKEQLMQRLLCLNSNVSTNLMRSGKLSGNGFQKVIDSAVKISESNIFIDDSASISVEEISRRLHKLKKSGKEIQYVFVDYFQLLKSEKKYACRRDHVDDSLAQLKQLAINQNVIVISLAQLNRSTMGLTDRRPILTDLRENSDYSNIDKAVYLYREDYYNPSVKDSVLEMIVVKNKNYEKYTYKASFDKLSLKISNFSTIEVG